MVDYFIFNDKDSRTIPGLVINELPPITKSGIRYETTEIEGRDGDIIDKKGYLPYDKKIEITLTTDYDINLLINWLNGSGKLILSNEPDKYYNAEIIEQIDFERLIIFKTATIIFHIQPYKYLVKENVASMEITEETSFKVNNQGLLDSKPIIKLYGQGKIEITINDLVAFNINIDEEYVVIDAMREDAYKDGILKNRQMSGDFENVRLSVGENIIKWTGNLTKIEVDPKSRWL